MVTQRAQLRWDGNWQQLLLIRQTRGTVALVTVAFVLLSGVFIITLSLAGGPEELSLGLLLIPVLLAAFYFGPLVGVGTALLAGSLAGPWMPYVPDVSQQVADGLLDIVIHALSAGLVGFFSARFHREAASHLEERHRRMAGMLSELERTPQLIDQERLHALGQMASGIAHDFNNALTPILGFTELLLTQPELLNDQAKTRKNLEAVHTAAKDAATIVSRLRTFYRPAEAGDISQAINLNQIVREVVLLTEPRWKAQAQATGATIRVGMDLGNIPVIRGNEVELRGALINLILNAADALPQGGVMTLHTRLSDDHVVVEVRDTGVGMTDEVRRRCLEPFFSTKGKSGTGLGLAIVYGTVRRHGGTVEIESKSGQGTTVTIRLPVRVGREPVMKEQEVAASVRPLRILVVEDEPTVREVVADCLEEAGHTVETGADGREGLEKFRAGIFDLVLVDGAMPEMSGVQLAARVKQVAPGTPVVLLTGFDAAETAGGSLQGVDVVIGKPLTLKELRQAVERAIAGQGARGTPATTPPTER